MVVAVSPPLVEKYRCAPKTWPCPICGMRGRRERERTRTVRHLAHDREAFWEITVGVYFAKCACSRQVLRFNAKGKKLIGKPMKYFTSTVKGVELGADYTDAVHRKIVDLIVRDRMTNDQVIAHLQEDFHLSVSVGFIYLCLARAQKKVA